MGSPIARDELVIGNPARWHHFSLKQREHNMTAAEREFFRVIVHPKTAERLTFAAPLPADIERLLEALRAQRSLTRSG